MARRLRDTQLFWVVVLAAVFWGAIWQHEKVAEWYHKASNSALVGRFLPHSAASSDSPEESQPEKKEKGKARKPLP
jgi:hypothetical protein